MIRQRQRFNVLFDEGLYPREKLPRTNERHNIRHIKHDFNYGGLSDDAVYEFAKSQNRLIATLNIKDFRKVESTPKETAENLRIPKKDAPNIATGSRKSLKKKFEKLTGRNLEWKNGYLCFLGTDARIPNSPYAPKE